LNFKAAIAKKVEEFKRKKEEEEALKNQ